MGNFAHYKLDTFAYIQIGIFADCHQMIFPDIYFNKTFGFSNKIWRAVAKNIESITFWFGIKLKIISGFYFFVKYPDKFLISGG